MLFEAGRARGSLVVCCRHYVNCAQASVPVLVSQVSPLYMMSIFLSDMKVSETSCTRAASCPVEI